MHSIVKVSIPCVWILHIRVLCIFPNVIYFISENFIFMEIFVVWPGEKTLVTTYRK